MPTTPNRNFFVIRDDTPIPARLKGAVLAIGNFDGLHRGHRAVISAALRLAAPIGAPALAVTFEPSPRRFFTPSVPQFHLTEEREKLRLMAATDLDGTVVMTFNAARAATEAADFINHDLIARFSPAGIVAGFDFHFGKGRKGTPDFLISEGARLGVPVEIVQRFDWQGGRVSSGNIRDALIAGDLAAANTMLGYPYFATGAVIHGDKRGRELNYPTANIRLDPGCGLKHGIYAVRAAVDGRLVEGVASFGRRPMFDNGAALLEVHLFDFAADLYDKVLDVAFIARIRDEATFDSLDALIRQMDDDSIKARAALSAAPDAFPKLGAIGS